MQVGGAEIVVASTAVAMVMVMSIPVMVMAMVVSEQPRAGQVGHQPDLGGRDAWPGTGRMTDDKAGQ